MNASRPSLKMQIFTELVREEPFRIIALFFIGFMTTTASLMVLCAFIGVQALTIFSFVHLGLTVITALAMAFSLYFVVGFIVWYRHEGFND